MKPHLLGHRCADIRPAIYQTNRRSVLRAPIVATLLLLLPSCSSLDSLMQKLGLGNPPQTVAEPAPARPRAAPLPEEKLEDILKKQVEISRDVRDQFLRERLGKAQQDDLHFVPYAGEEWAQVTRKKETP